MKKKGKHEQDAKGEKTKDSPEPEEETLGERGRARKKRNLRTEKGTLTPSDSKPAKRGESGKENKGERRPPATGGKGGRRGESQARRYIKKEITQRSRHRPQNLLKNRRLKTGEPQGGGYWGEEKRKEKR